MGFLGDIVGSILDGDGSSRFGQTVRKDEPTFSKLYKLSYFDFGLTPYHDLKNNPFVPMKLSTGWDFGNTLYSFEIRGNIHHPMKFMSSGWGSPFHMFDRELPAPKGRVWAYDVSRLHEGILAVSSVFPDDAAHVQSEEYLKVLRIVGDVILPTLTKVPALSLDFGPMWEKFRIPDGISVGLETMSPLSHYHMEKIITRITHAYGRNGTRIVADYDANPETGVITLVMREATSVPPQPSPPPQSVPKATDADFINNLNAFVENMGNRENTQNVPTDSFPYEFYRGLGLIDSEDMVLMPSLLGAVRVPMNNPLAKEHLMKYQPEN